MARQTGVAQRMFRALADAGANIAIITTSEIKISVLVPRDHAQASLRTIHSVFGLEKHPPKVSDASLAKIAAAARQKGVATDAIEVVRTLQGMEDLTIDDVSLDDSQARVTITGVPDTPGVAAQVFEEVAQGGVFVDMIVQSYGRKGHANLSFTVPQADLDKSVQLVQKLAQRLSCGGVTSSPRVAKLSVSGIGMRSHTGVAIRMFQSLSAAGINVDMINTSEVRVNVVVDGSQGGRALKALEAAFADARR
jgi:aspartate kinase